ncbi:hypothetical protein ASE85_02470 [Sphingobium sp. Leaf26]|uniref:hypothetical protein n=1 Tax=Sphingobium sp. Leaf26 TaxID=1735693 RepID=UPI0006FE4E83|nr:hypothetical protein [Sphingobium sp. Leaf26]KQN09819.1 hypothetical protein ASE85_02470 [Sphingobium sp. Leaf26]
MATQIGICNDALSEVAADPIDSIDEASSSAFYCRQHYPNVIAEMMSWTDFDFLNRRTTLALRPNDRKGEWLYRYGKPNDMAEAIAVLPKVEDQRTNLPTAGPFNFPDWSALGRLPFLIAETSIYTNVANAIIEYQVNTVEPAAIDAMTARAVALELASRLAMPLKKSARLKGDLIKLAEVARQRAIAESENRNPVRETRYVSEAEYARMGYGIDGV